MKFTLFSRRNCNMKKTLIIAASILAIAGCKKAELAPEQGQENLITRKVSLAADDATVKSFFDTNDKFVKLTGAEELAVAYSNADENTYMDGKPVVAGIIKGTSDGSSNYSFSHSAIDKATGYNYYFILPYRDSKNISTNGNKTGLYVQLDSIQHPTATSFDPLQDYIMGQPIYNAKAQATEMTAENLKLKRLFALVRLTLNDSQKVLGGAALDQVSFSFPPARENKQNTSDHKKHNLINRCYLTFSKDFNDSKISGYGDWGTVQARATVTAEYNEGLAPGEDGKYTVWYVTMPVEKLQGTELTVVVKSGIKTITRTVAIPAAMALQAGVINDIKFDISGTGYDSKEIDTNDYWSLYNAGQNITVGGQVINNTKYPGGVLLQGEVTQAQLQKGGLLFLDTDVTMGYHYKPGANTILIGRKKNAQPKLTVDSKYSIYFTKGNVVLKNLNITSGTTASQLFVTTNEIASDIDYAVVEDCNIMAKKSVYKFGDNAPDFVVKSITFDNCIIKMAGTDANYMVLQMNQSDTSKPTYDGYGKMEAITVNNCVIYADQVLPKSGSAVRRMIADYGSNSEKKVTEGEVEILYYYYAFPTSKLNITVTNNTIVNLNANGNILVRAYIANNATINKNVVYTDLTPVTGNYSATYMFGLYNALEGEGTHEYKVRENYSYGKRGESDTADAIKWKYTSAGPHGTYSVGANTAVYNNTAKLPITIDSTTPGYFPINTAVVTNGAGASYDTKYWITAGK